LSPIRSIHNWFARVVYERGTLDSSLEKQAERGHYLTRGIAQVARLFLWLSRKLLYLLMQAAAALSGALSRQMEYDADRYQARVVGSRVSAAILAEIPRLGAAAHAASSELNWHYREGRLASDIPAVVLEHRQKFTAETLQEIDGANRREKRAWYSTHPSHVERRANLATEPAEGVYRSAGSAENENSERPARELFTDFAEVCRAASVAEYRESLGETFDEGLLVDTAEIERERVRESAAGEAFVRLFGAVLSRSRALELGIFETAILEEAERAALAAELTRLSAAARQEREELEPKNRRYADLEQRLALLAALEAMREAELPAAEWGPREEVAALLGEEPDVPRAIVAATAEQNGLREALRASDERSARRLALAVAVSTDAGVKREAAGLATALSALDRTLPTVLTLRRHVHGVQALVDRIEKHRKEKAFNRELDARYAELHAELSRLFQTLDGLPNPLGTRRSPGGNATLQLAIVRELPKVAQATQTLAIATEATGLWIELRIRLLMRLAELAEPGERAATGVAS